MMGVPPFQAALNDLVQHSHFNQVSPSSLETVRQPILEASPFQPPGAMGDGPGTPDTLEVANARENRRRILRNAADMYVRGLIVALRAPGSAMLPAFDRLAKTLNIGFVVEDQTEQGGFVVVANPGADPDKCKMLEAIIFQVKTVLAGTVPVNQDVYRPPPADDRAYA